MPARTTQKKRGRANYLAKGQNNVICDRTGFKYKSGDVREEWNGLIVGKDQWEARQPQDFVTSVPDNQSPAVSRPGGADRFLTTNEVKPSDL